MSKKSIILSAEGLKNIVINEEEKFIFVIGQKELKISRFFAEFISPAVSHIHHCDPTINSINITKFLNIKSNNQIKSKKREDIIKKLETDLTLSQILNLSQGQCIDIEDDSELIALRYLSILLNNEELFNIINKLTKNEYKTKSDDEILEEISFFSEIKSKMNEVIFSKLIDELSTRISKDKQNLLEKVPKGILYLILHNENFKYDDTDKLFEIINKVFSSENEDEDEEEIEYHINSFYEMIDINKLSQNKYESFIRNLKINEMTGKLWYKLCEILIYNHQENNHKEKNNKEKEYKYDGQTNNRFNGIIQHLRGSEKTNICDLGIIDVTSSYQTDSDKLPKNAVDFDNDKYFKSNDSRAWLKYDFKDKKIRPTHYSIKTRNDSDQQNPMNWVIEVSNTNKDNDWRIIDSRNGITTVSRRNQTDTFNISTQLMNESYRYIRFRTTGNTSNNCGCLAISSLEYFGILIK